MYIGLTPTITSNGGKTSAYTTIRYCDIDVTNWCTYTN